jgi:hypothetical protein
MFESTGERRRVSVTAFVNNRDSQLSFTWIVLVAVLVGRSSVSSRGVTILGLFTLVDSPDTRSADVESLPELPYSLLHPIHPHQLLPTRILDARRFGKFHQVLEVAPPGPELDR